MKITERNPYVRFFRSLREIEIDENTRIVLSQSTVLDQRVYNAPLSDEVVVVWPDGASPNQISTSHILVYGKSAQTHRICHYYGCYDPLQYPLLFPHGECGWTQNLKKRIAIGKNQTHQVLDPIHSCAVHTVQNFLDEEASRAFVVDMYVKIENIRLDYLRNNQDIIRADLYQGILDSVTSGETDASKIGHLVVLPPSFIGCPRDLKCRYKCYGISSEIMKEKVFGEVAAMIYVVEFQKRGLPHAHFLIILKFKFKIRGPTEYDKFVSAEIPSLHNPLLHKVVMTHMMHGPCGKLNPRCPCMKMDERKLVCKNGYPKDYIAETANNKDGYTVYRRRQTGEKVKIRQAELDNQWVYLTIRIYYSCLTVI
ncbi:uncharacterized protein LOC110734584 [Chenopodium quinoa]|uniref:uncharacterized protein LOC110734584 n=1 Tax=Chenopodium quinoa TaxID=63459 RepID=UPI000B789A6A|nr:uncharacterized protein LOC110734584 [Chenopodium quinoa]